MNWFRRLRLRSRRSSKNSLEYLGEDFIQRATHAARKESWGRTVVQLAWTAGPVTYLALQGGYILGYGTTAPANLFIYFAMYTVIAGIFAVAVRFLYQFTRGQEKEKAEAALTHCLVHLPDLIMYARNQTLLYYDEENRQLLAAKHLLENPDSGAPTIQEAVYDITGDDTLARAARRIEMYRRNGLDARIQDEAERVAGRLEKTLEHVRLSSQTVADLLAARFAGKPPSRRTGRTRTEGFIGRVLAAGEKNDFEAMTLNDAEEVYTLAYELLAGREIPLFSLRYTGSREFTEASENFERARLTFHKAVYARNSKLREMAELFAESDNLDIVPAAAPIFTTVDRMYANILRALEEQYRELKKHTSRLPGGRRRRRKNNDLKQAFERLDYAVKLHRSLRVTNNQLNKCYAALRRAENRYNDLRKKTAKQFPLHLLKPGEHGKGIKIVEKHIKLSRKSNMRLAGEVQRLLQALEKNPSPTTEDYKKTAIDIAMKLETSLKISRFEVQYAIEGSNAPYLSALDVDMTAATKAGMAVALVREVQKNMHTPIHRLAYVLVNYHGMPLNEESIEFLADRYGADRERLRHLLPEEDAGNGLAEAATARDENTLQEAAPVEKAPPEPTHEAPPHMLEIHRLDKKYQDLVDEAVKLNVV